MRVRKWTSLRGRFIQDTMIDKILMAARERLFHTQGLGARLSKLQRTLADQPAESRLPQGYFDRHILFHTHIAKSAGTSIVDAFTDMLGRDSVMDRNKFDDPHSAVPSLSLSRRRALKLLSGHFWYGTQERYFERRPVYVASVRDPIERFNSLYHFVLAGDGHPFRREFEARGPDGSARWFFLDNPRLANEMANSFGVPPDVSPIDWVEHRYAIVAPSLRIDSMIAKLYAIFAPDMPPRIWRSNPAPRSGFAISTEVAEECHSVAANDVLLCRQIEDRYDDWLHNLGARLRVE